MMFGAPFSRSGSLIIMSHHVSFSIVIENVGTGYSYD